MEEVQQIHDFMNKVGDNVQVIWGATFDDSLGDNVTIIATGYDRGDIPGMPAKPAKEVQKTPVHNLVRWFRMWWRPFILLWMQKTEKKNLGNNWRRNAESNGSVLRQTTSLKSNSEPEPEPELELQTFTLEELEDESTLKSVENIPAWKRRLLR